MLEEELNLSIENFDGPLDVLLTLIKDKKMDIFEIDLSELASAYLKLIDKLKDTNIDLASEYLVMAASLIQLKARMMLQSPENKEQIEKDKQEILQQLIEYQQFKSISGILRDRERKRKNIFIKTKENYDIYAKEIDESKLDGSSDAIKLIIALRKMFERSHAQKLKETTIETFKLTAAERRLEIIEIFRKNPNPTLDEIFSVPSVNHLVLTILTLLDMARRQEIVLSQDEQYGIIKIRKGVIDVY